MKSSAKHNFVSRSFLSDNTERFELYTQNLIAEFSFYLFVNNSVHYRNNFQILFSYAYFCNVIFFAVLRKINKPLSGGSLFQADPALHSLVDSIFNILFFFNNYFYTIHHFHFIYLSKVYLIFLFVNTDTPDFIV